MGMFLICSWFSYTGRKIMEILLAGMIKKSQFLNESQEDSQRTAPTVQSKNEEGFQLLNYEHTLPTIQTIDAPRGRNARRLKGASAALNHLEDSLQLLSRTSPTRDHSLAEFQVNRFHATLARSHCLGLTHVTAPKALVSAGQEMSKLPCPGWRYILLFGLKTPCTNYLSRAVSRVN